MAFEAGVSDFSADDGASDFSAVVVGHVHICHFKTFAKMVGLPVVGSSVAVHNIIIYLIILSTKTQTARNGSWGQHGRGVTIDKTSNNYQLRKNQGVNSSVAVSGAFGQP